MWRVLPSFYRVSKRNAFLFRKWRRFPRVDQSGKRTAASRDRKKTRLHFGLASFFFLPYFRFFFSFFLFHLLRFSTDLSAPIKVVFFFFLFFSFTAPNPSWFVSSRPAVTRFYWVYWVLRGWAWFGWTRFNRVWSSLPGFTSNSKFDWIVLGFPGFSLVSPGFTGFYWVFPSHTGFSIGTNRF